LEGSPTGPDRLRLNRKKTLAAQHGTGTKNKKARAKLNHGTWFWYALRVTILIAIAIPISAWLRRTCWSATDEKSQGKNQNWNASHAKN
jgi:hypothetical protein